MTTKNSKVLACRVDIRTYKAFSELAKSVGLTPGEHLKNIIVKGLERKRGVNPIRNEEVDIRRVNPIELDGDGNIIPEM